LAKLQAKKDDCLTRSVRLSTVLLKDEELARDLELTAVVYVGYSQDGKK